MCAKMFPNNITLTHKDYMFPNNITLTDIVDYNSGILLERSI